MADNTTLNTGTGGDVYRSKDRTGVKTSIVALDLAPGGAETLMNGVMPVSDNSGTLTVDAPVGTPVFVRLSDGSSAIATLPVSLAALPSTAHRVTATPTISTTPAYTAGDALGGLQTLATGITSGGTFVLDSITILDLAKLDAAMDIVFFDQSFTASTDNVVFDPSDADAANILGVVNVAAGHYADFNDWSAATVRNIGLGGKLSGSANLYAQAVIRSAVTYASTTDLKFVYSLREV